MDTKSSDLNIVFMGNFPYPHGLAGTKRVQSFIDYLCSLNVRPRILILRQGGEEIPRSRLTGYYHGVYYRTIGYGLKLDPSLIYKLPLFFIHGSIALIKWRTKSFGNYIYCYNGLDIENLLFVLVAKALGYKIIFDIVEDFSRSEDQPHFLARLKNRSWTCLDRRILKIADGIVVISKYLKNKYDDRKNRVPVQLIPISAKCHAIGDTGRAQSHGTITFVYAGSFGEKDDVLTLIDAFENIHQRRRNSKLCLLGKGGQLQKVKDRIRGLASVRYEGYLADKEFYEFLNEADVLCMTRTRSQYSHAGFPFKLGEYLATGKPVIASNVGDVGLYLRGGEDAFLVDPEDMNALEKAMEYCIDNYDAAVKIGRSGMEKCKGFFNPDTNGQLFVELMNICKDGNSRSRLVVMPDTAEGGEGYSDTSCNKT